MVSRNASSGLQRINTVISKRISYTLLIRLLYNHNVINCIELVLEYFKLLLMFIHRQSGVAGEGRLDYVLGEFLSYLTTKGGFCPGGLCPGDNALNSAPPR